ncbi:MAG: ZIP family metal transporter [Chitinophagaceae bacterium]
MEAIVQYFNTLTPVWAALLGGLFTWAVTSLGSSLVFLFRNVSRSIMDTMLGLSGGIMLAASFFSLLKPSIEMSEISFPTMPWMPAVVGFALGALFVFGLDKLTPHLHLNFQTNQAEGISTSWQRTTLLVLAITLHNIPEGLAVGVVFGAAAQGVGDATMASAIALAIGIGLQDFPEGFAVSMPLRRLGLSRRRSFVYGSLSAIVEPIFAVIGAVAIMFMQSFLPFALAFAAGAMIFVVVEEVIPETQQDKFTDVAALGFIAGFLIMMFLDVSLG